MLWCIGRVGNIKSSVDTGDVQNTGWEELHGVNRIFLHIGEREFYHRLDNGSPVSREAHAGLCVQLRLACSAGVSPAGVEVRAPVA